ncbi:hypothetical protein HPT28_17015 [Streptomyces sp. JJ38]|nr:hypothetical protein [Streptomyces sp. JJ38]
MTVTQLRELAFKEGDVPEARDGGIPVRESEPAGTSRPFPPVSDPTCQTMRDIAEGRPAAARIVQVFNWEGDVWGGESTLASYKHGQAEQHFTKLEQALASCRFFTGESYTGEYTASVVVEAPPQFGDEAVSFQVIIPLGPELPEERNEHFTVVRAGNTIASFSKLDVGEHSSFPADLISRQVERLRSAQRS